MTEEILCKTRDSACHSLFGICSPVFLSHMEPESDPLVRHKHDSGEVIFSDCPNLSSFSSIRFKGRHQKKNRLFLGKSPKLWVGGGQES